MVWYHRVALGVFGSTLYISALYIVYVGILVVSSKRISKQRLPKNCLVYTYDHAIIFAAHTVPFR